MFKTVIMRKARRFIPTGGVVRNFTGLGQVILTLIDEEHISRPKWEIGRYRVCDGGNSKVTRNIKNI